MLVFTKPIEEPRIRAAVGMPVPPKYAKNKEALKWFKAKYGDDCVMDVSFKYEESTGERINADAFRSLVSNGKANEQLVTLRATCEEQAKIIKTLQAENADLKRKLKDRPQ